MKKKKVEMKIELDLETKFYKVSDIDYIGTGGGMSGRFKNKQHFLDEFNWYFQKYICLDLKDKRRKLEYEQFE